MSKLIISSLFFVLITSPLAVTASGIPVFDGANMAQAVQQVIHMIEQIEQLKNQLDVAENQLKQMSDVRNMGGIIGSEYDNEMDVDYQDVLDSAEILSSNDFDLTASAGDLFDKQNRAAARWKGRSEKFMNQAVDRFTELQKLVQKVNAAPDAKDVMDLQARIQSEETLLQNEMLKLQMMQSESMAEQAMLEQKQKIILLNMWGNPADFRL
jgi:type IV secretion system protein VirB5